MLSHLLPLITSLPLTLSSPTTPTPTPTTTTCNGHPSYCNTPYSNFTFLASHDAPFIGPLPQQNQNLAIPDQLDLGIRFLQAQTHFPPATDDKDSLHVCHTSCILEDGGSLEEFLGEVKSWLDGHPDEVVTVLLTNGDNAPVESFGKGFEKVGLDGYAFVPEKAGGLEIDEWPSLGGLIERGKRLVVFLDYGANTTSTPYILDEFAYFFETPFDVTNGSFPDCSIDRPPGVNPDGRVLVPDRAHAARTNAVTGDGSIGAQSDPCQSLYGRKPNVVLVDFVDKGEVMEAQDALNGVSASPLPNSGSLLSRFKNSWLYLYCVFLIIYLQD
ncbi:hypothetical protein MW887_010180 [Aspergillus wentii]|nr:hypothetical protein MW887_010180 [Aspergillus wentii]